MQRFQLATRKMRFGRPLGTGKAKCIAANKIAKAERLARKRDNARARELYRQACGLKPAE